MNKIDKNDSDNFKKTLSSRKKNVINLSNRKIKNLADIIEALKNIYYHPNTLWSHARNGRGRHRETNVNPYKVNVDNLLEQIGIIIYDYFCSTGNTINNQNNFDEFHKNLCEKFLKGINKIRKSAGLVDMSYGQAQKLINLTFKYLSAYDDYDTYADLFSYCHMVIDSVVLCNLTKSKIQQLLNHSINQGISNLKGSSYNGKGWTSFDEKDYTNLVKEYRKVIDPYKGNSTYMQIEYCLWPSARKLKTNGNLAKMINKFHM